jgi:basic membrane protein A and related proteins
LTLRQKLIGLLLAAALAGAAVACGGGSDGGDDSPAADDTLKVGLLTDQGQLNDRGFNELAYRGLKDAERKLGIETRVVQAVTAADYVPNITSLIRQDFDLIIGVGFAHGDAVTKSAARFPETKFAIIDVDQSSLPGQPENVVGLLFKEQQVGYLAGYAAALAEKRRPGPDVISSVAGMKEPPVDRFIAGYQAGAKAIVPDVTILHGYSQDWEDLAKCKELALNHIARGAGVVFQVAGGCGLGALDAAKEKGVWGIGVDADQFFLGQHILTSAMKRVDEAVFATIESVQEGTWRGGRNLVFGLENEGVALGTFSSDVPQEDREAIDAVAKKIAEGEITVPTRF